MHLKKIFACLDKVVQPSLLLLLFLTSIRAIYVWCLLVWIFQDKVYPKGECSAVSSTMGWVVGTTFPGVIYPTCGGNDQRWLIVHSI